MAISNGTHSLRSFSRTFALVVLSLSSVAAAPAPADNAINAYLESVVKEGSNPAISVAISQNSRVTYFNAGFADRERHVAATQHTVYRVGSITKALTATAAEVLAAQGRINLDAPINLYLKKRLPGDFVQPTLRQLLGMSGGVPHGWLYLDKPDEDIAATDEPYAVVSRPPGSNFEYSNYSYGVLGVALSRSTRMPFSEVMRRYVFAPMGMHDTFVNVRPPTGSVLAKPYQHKIAQPAPNLYLYPMAGAGAFSSAADLIGFARYHMGEGRITRTFPPALAAEVHSRAHLANGFYSRGWAQVALSTSHEAWLTNGEALGGCATILIVPTLHLAVAVLTNICHGRQTDDIATRVLSELSPRDATALDKVLNGGGEAPGGTASAPRAPTGTWHATISVSGSQAHSVTITLDGARATCGIDKAVPTSAAFTREADGTLSFACAGPPTVDGFVSRTLPGVTSRIVKWEATLDFRDRLLHGAIGARSQGDNGFDLNFAVRGSQ